MQRFHSTTILGLVLGTALACANDPSEPTAGGPTGRYVATQFTIVTADTTINELAEGVTISILLAADGTTSGTLRVPAVDATTPLVGTYALAYDSLTFAHTPGTVLTLAPFRIEGDRLRAEGRVGPGTFHITLTRR